MVLNAFRVGLSDGLGHPDRLQKPEDNLVIATTVLERADMLNVEGGESSLWVWQYSHRSAARCLTRARVAAVMRAAGFELFGLTAEDGDEFVRPDVAGIIIAFLRCEGVLGVLGGEFLNAHAE